MIQKNLNCDYIYSFKYDIHTKELCRLESRHLFADEESDKLLFSNRKVDPGISSFIKSRFNILSFSEDYSRLLEMIEKKDISVDGFKVEYLILNGDTATYADRLKKLRDVGYCIEGTPDYNEPSITYAICYYECIWYFGILEKDNADWLIHKRKPCSFSNSINMEMAKSLVSIASRGKQGKRLLDACCGVGTIMLEACFSGFSIDGCDNNWKACKNTEKNLSHFNYKANVYYSDIKNLEGKYDAIIIDLPYNLYTYSNDAIAQNIIESAAKLTTRMVIVSISNIGAIIKKSGFEINDFCTVEKRRNSNFTRSVWVCDTVNNTI